MGYFDKFKVYILNDLNQKQIILNSDVTFDESKIGYKHLDGKILILEKKLFPIRKNIWEFLA